jgi:hypothetical protein
MVHVRGVLVLNAVRFVRETFGPAQQQAVVDQLAPEWQAAFLVPLREVSWKPLELFVGYMDAARRLLAPQDASFFRKLGAYAGRQERADSNFKIMVADPLTAMRLAPMVWRSFHDAGRLEVERVNDRESLARLYDFPPSVPMCERRCGAWQALLSGDELIAEVSETRCLRLGDACCETHTVWSPR